MAAVVSVLLCAGATAAHASSLPVTIGVYGDSVAEGEEIPSYLTESLVPQLRTSVARAGRFQRGGTGFIAVNPFRWKFNDYTLAGLEAPRANAWVLSGQAVDAADGLSGYSAIALSARSTATAPIDGSQIGILFTKFPGGGVFTVTAGAQTFTIDSRSTGPPTPAAQWISVPAHARSITVHGTGSGSLVFNGIIDRKPVSAGHIAIEVENLGHRGHRLSEDSAPRILAALRQQHFDISVFLDAYIWEYLAAASTTDHYERAYAKELRARVGLVRRYGGLCLIADSSPLYLPDIARFAAVGRRIAREERCAYTSALTHLWNPLTAAKNGLTLVDMVHPTAAGYRLMTRVLAPILVKLVRQRARTASP